MRRIAVVVALVIAGTVAGCMKLPDTQPEGIVSIAIRPEQVSSTSITPKLIPQIAEKIRIRIWNIETGFNTVATASIGDKQMSIAVPQGNRYSVDAVSYYVKNNMALALTGGSAPNVSVKANETTSIQLGLRPWHTEVVGDERVEPSKSYAVEFVATDAGGLITRGTFESASLHASTTSFQDPDDALPAEPGTYGILFDDRMTFMATAPNVSEVSSLFVGVLVEFTQNWTDDLLENVNERTLVLELPNRHLEAPLHQLIIDPSTGGIVIDISGERQE